MHGARGGGVESRLGPGCVALNARQSGRVWALFGMCWGTCFVCAPSRRCPVQCSELFWINLEAGVTDRTVADVASWRPFHPGPVPSASFIHAVFSLAGDPSLGVTSLADSAPALRGVWQPQRALSFSSVLSLALLFTFLTGGHDRDEIPKFHTLSLPKP